MRLIRHHLLRHRRLALLLVAAGLLMRMGMPAGYMPSATGGVFAIELCPSGGEMPMAMPGMSGQPDKKGDHGKADMPCAFSGLGMASLAAADPILLALALAFVFALAFQAVAAARVALPTYLRPPLRGPPTIA